MSAAPQRRERDLDVEQNERVRALVRALLGREGETQVQLAPRLGMRQPALSGFLSGRQGTSFAVARRAALLAGVDVDDVLAGRPTSPDPYPERARVLSAVGDAHPAAVAHVRSMVLQPGSQPSAIEWARIVAYWDAEARAGRLP